MPRPGYEGWGPPAGETSADRLARRGADPDDPPWDPPSAHAVCGMDVEDLQQRVDRRFT
ncbi:hypothetical protein OV090_22115 [Nannocystis sp. RBIL2]|uniref:hypothetical protein n=1 Tax=Nannocystis sp. RBIL2 TaxID=2996788 RepID=UPI00226E80F6|nr:hypothetical protein [Nannocystis sp. RBIL2]MCY1067459.1 hypothetical protein [Nannocystis sp. RBIL2]